jgi:hypothetical protein
VQPRNLQVEILDPWCPDGVVLPFAAYPDGTTKVYTDPDHAGESFYRA